MAARLFCRTLIRGSQHHHSSFVKLTKDACHLKMEVPSVRCRRSLCRGSILMGLDIICPLPVLCLEVSHRVSSHHRLQACPLKLAPIPYCFKPLVYVRKQRTAYVLS